jgi:hypothetical protein
MSEERDKNLINFIAATVEGGLDRMDNQMATKDDLAALKDQMATKRELAELKDVMATKTGIARLEANLARVESQMATKDGVPRLEMTMHGEFERVHIRIDSIDRGMGSRMGLIETDISRLRSVIYLLVKDKPDMLRLLGQPDAG